MSRYVVSRRAQRDLLGIRDWIERDNPARAISFVEDLMVHFARLAEMPLIGRRRDEFGQGVRSIGHGNFIIFYRLRTDHIGIVRVLHGRRDIGRALLQVEQS